MRKKCFKKPMFLALLTWRSNTTSLFGWHSIFFLCHAKHLRLSLVLHWLFRHLATVSLRNPFRCVNSKSTHDFCIHILCFAYLVDQRSFFFKQTLQFGKRCCAYWRLLFLLLTTHTCQPTPVNLLSFSFPPSVRHPIINYFCEYSCFSIWPKSFRLRIET